MILSFPNNHEGQTRPYSDALRKLCELLPKVSRDWRYQIACAELDGSRILMTLAKPAVVIGAIQTIINMKKEMGTRSSIALFLDTGPGHRDTTLTDERQLLVHDVICRLMTFMGHHVTEVAHSHDLVSPAAAPGAAQTLVCVTGNSRLDLRCVWAPGSESQATDPETEPRQTDLAPERQAAAGPPNSFRACQRSDQVEAAVILPEEEEEEADLLVDMSESGASDRPCRRVRAVIARVSGARRLR
ncbi:uncharacterized protein LOC119098365 [Pollicipes pollicipes]|uniref:uncharacterized protein LOC119098365 n=1 Tax=Pollicipes pollicipes TaxID=41117 RepID=UPI0018854A1D|nr:uncharacterized protein LOC119098365 [Pollicipes pollicipes]